MKACVVGALLVLALGAPPPGRAEGYLDSPYLYNPTLIGASWSIARPLRSTSQFIDAWSPAGFDVEFRRGLVRRVSVGGDFSLNAFSRDLAGGLRREFHAIALRATVHWYLTGSEIQPYLGVGAGGLYREAAQNGSPTRAGFGALLEPQAGLLLTIGQGLAVNLSLRYTVTRPPVDVVGAVYIRTPQWIAGQIGVAVY